MHKYTVILTAITFVIISFAFTSDPMISEHFSMDRSISIPQTTKWVAPDSANKMVNPNEDDEESLEEGLLIYNKNCRSCHGKLGDGQGSGAADLETKPTDFTLPEFLTQSDGSMYWKIYEGRGDMKKYNEKLDSDEIWYVVTYIKSFAGSN